LATQKSRSDLTDSRWSHQNESLRVLLPNKTLWREPWARCSKQAVEVQPSTSRRHLIASETSKAAVPRSHKDIFRVNVSNSASSKLLGLTGTPPSGITDDFLEKQWIMPSMLRTSTSRSSTIKSSFCKRKILISKALFLFKALRFAMF
jgi:hypothetical protein